MADVTLPAAFLPSHFRYCSLKMTLAHLCNEEAMCEQTDVL
jgi:hypothetical protein